MPSTLFFKAFRNRVVKNIELFPANPQTLESIVNEYERWQDRFSGQHYDSVKSPIIF